MAIHQTDTPLPPLFSLRPALPLPKPILLAHSFTDSPPQDPDLSVNKADVPCFNQDGCHFTPSFILPRDSVHLPSFRTTIGPMANSSCKCSSKKLIGLQRKSLIPYLISLQRISDLLTPHRPSAKFAGFLIKTTFPILTPLLTGQTSPSHLLTALFRRFAHALFKSITSPK